MKIYDNVLDKTTIDALFLETRKSQDKDVWRFSTLFWTPEIQVGAMAATACKVVSEELAPVIEQQIKHLLPPYESLLQQIYLWPRGASISRHDDAHCKWGATIYLNTSWDIDNGGLFVWQDKESAEWKVRIPEFNTLVVNDNKEPHLVTPVAYTSMDMRHTVQIWGL